MNVSLLRLETGQVCLHSPLLFSIILEILDSAISQEKEIKGIRNWKERSKTSLFEDNIIDYDENPKLHQQWKNLLEFIRHQSNSMKKESLFNK